MPQRMREPRTSLPTEEEIERRVEEGWRLTALEWVRDQAETSGEPASEPASEIPFGLRVAPDGFSLEEEPDEQAILRQILEALVDDRPLSQIASRLNDAGSTTRHGDPWTQSAVFSLLPRIVEVGPQIFRTREWHDARQERRLRAL